MNLSASIIDEIRQRHELKSDYAAAKLLQVRQSTIINYRKDNGSEMSDDVAQRAAQLLDMDAEILVSKLHYKRAKTDNERELWQRIVQRLGGTAAAVLLAVVTVLPSHVDASENRHLQGSTSEHCILC